MDEETNKDLKSRLPVASFIELLRKCPSLVGLMLDSLSLRLRVDETEVESQQINTSELARRSSEIYGKVDFVGPANSNDAKIEVTVDHINAILKSRRLRILCRLTHRGQLEESLVISYSDALVAIAAVVVGPEFRLLPYNNNSHVHISDWWDERLEDALGQSTFA